APDPLVALCQQFIQRKRTIRRMAQQLGHAGPSHCTGSPLRRIIPSPKITHVQNRPQKRMGRKLKIDWQETALELKKRYRTEHNAERQTRLYSLWHLRLGKTLKEIAEAFGMSYRTLQDWVARYRQCGLAAVLETDQRTRPSRQTSQIDDGVGELGN